MKQISVSAFREIVRTTKKDDDVDLINVCTPGEYDNKHIHSVRNIPLGDIEKRADELRDKKTIYVICGSGNRSQMAIEKMKNLNINAELINVTGGLLAWEAAGFATGHSTTTKLPLVRQIFITAGVLILVGLFGALFIHPYFSILIFIVGAGLTFSGVTGWCGMAFILARMPWNK